MIGLGIDIGEIGLIVMYFIGFIYTWRIIAGKITYDIAASSERMYPALNRGKSLNPDAGQYAGGYFLGFFCAIPWPVMALMKVLAGSSSINYVPAEIKQKKQDLVIKELEKELLHTKRGY